MWLCVLFVCMSIVSGCVPGSRKADPSQGTVAEWAEREPQIAYRDGTGGYWLTDLSGKKKTALGDLGGNGYSWSPDGAYLALTGGRWDEATHNRFAVVEVGPPTKSVADYEPEDVGAAVGFGLVGWSDDGRRAMVQADDALLAIDAGTGDTEPVARPGEGEYLSPNGMRSASYGSGSVIIYSADDSREVALPDDAQDSQVQGLAWSPDSGSLFLTVGSEGGKSRTWSVPAASGGAVQLPGMAGVVTQVAAGGGHLLVQGGEGAKFAYGVYDIASRKLTAAVPSAPARARWMYYHAALSPDGEWVAYDRCTDDPVRRQRTPDELWVVRADGSGEHRLVADGYWPTWRPSSTGKGRP